MGTTIKANLSSSSKLKFPLHNLFPQRCLDIPSLLKLLFLSMSRLWFLFVFCLCKLQPKNLPHHRQKTVGRGIEEVQ